MADITCNFIFILKVGELLLIEFIMNNNTEDTFFFPVSLHSNSAYKNVQKEVEDVIKRWLRYTLTDMVDE